MFKSKKEQDIFSLPQYLKNEQEFILSARRKLSHKLRWFRWIIILAVMTIPALSLFGGSKYVLGSTVRTNTAYTHNQSASVFPPDLQYQYLQSQQIYRQPPSPYSLQPQFMQSTPPPALPNPQVYGQNYMFNPATVRYETINTRQYPYNFPSPYSTQVSYNSFPRSSLSESEKKCIENWIRRNNLNQFGDPRDTVYTGGTPLFDERTGQTIDRYQYIIMNHPDKPWFNNA